MTEKPDTSGPAFPGGSVSFGPYQYGMSLRDWFAGQALSGMDISAWGGPKIPSEMAYAAADAMLAARGAK